MGEEKQPERRAGCRARLVLLLASVGFCLLVAEGVMWLLPREKPYDPGTMDPGLAVYDARLGWKLARSWTGAHHHEDFDVRYSTNRRGHRSAGDEDREKGIPVLGDSFTFGLGVNDGETFAARLNEGDSRQAYINAGVVGYATDQQVLMFESLQEFYDYREAILVVYLGNDLIDNSLAFPLQADKAKPRFELAGGELELRNTPVPKQPKPPAGVRTMAEVVMKDPPRPSRARGLLEHSALMQRVFRVRDGVRYREVEWSPAVNEQFELFVGIVGRLRGRLREDWTLPIVLLPGRSFAEEPYSLSARYQEMVRRQILDHDWGERVVVVDAASALKEASVEGQLCYFPHEGHLNAAGHQVVAEVITEALKSIE